MAEGFIEWKCKICGKTDIEPHNNNNLPPMLSLAGLCKEHAGLAKAYQSIQEEKTKKEREKNQAEETKRKKSQCAYCSYQFQEGDPYFCHDENPNRYFCFLCNEEINQITEEVDNYVTKVNEFLNWEEEIVTTEELACLQEARRQVDTKLKEIANLQGKLKEIKQICRKYSFHKWLNNTGKNIESFLKELSKGLTNYHTELTSQISKTKFKIEKEVKEKEELAKQNYYPESAKLSIKGNSESEKQVNQRNISNQQKYLANLQSQKQQELTNQTNKKINSPNTFFWLLLAAGIILILLFIFLVNWINKKKKSH